METETERPTSLWHHPNFLKLWTSDTISQFGTQFSGYAIPFTALLITSDPLTFSILTVSAFISFPLFALFIGVYVDRHRRQRIMVVANVGRGISLGLIPLAAVTGTLTRAGMPLLYIVSFMVGLLTVFFDISYQAILPSLVERSQLVEGNSKLEWSRSGAQVVGPGLAGLVVQAVFPPLAIAIDATSYIASASVLSRINRNEVIKPPVKGVWHDLKEGLAIVLKDKRLRSIAGSTATSNFFTNAIFAILILYLVRQLGYTAAVIGTIFFIGGLGAFAGIALSSRLARMFGVGPAIIAAMIVGGLGAIPYALVNPSLSTPIFIANSIPLLGTFRLDLNALILMAGGFVVSIGVVVYNINQVSLRQSIVPRSIQGRMNATMRWIVWGTIPVGALAGGVLGEVFGLREAIAIAVVGGIFAFLWVFLSPVRSLRKIPEPPEE
jgi:MFS family permease